MQGSPLHDRHFEIEFRIMAHFWAAIVAKGSSVSRAQLMRSLPPRSAGCESKIFLKSGLAAEVSVLTSFDAFRQASMIAWLKGRIWKIACIDGVGRTVRLGARDIQAGVKHLALGSLLA